METVRLHVQGRGSGKTYKAMRRVEKWAKKSGTRIAIVGDRRVILQELFHNSSDPRKRPEWIASRSTFRWANGSEAQVFSPENPDSLRGPQFHYAVGDNIRNWNTEVLHNLVAATRLGKKPRVHLNVCSTDSPIVKDILGYGFIAKPFSGTTPISHQFLSESFLRLLGSMYTKG